MSIQFNLINILLITNLNHIYAKTTNSSYIQSKSYLSSIPTPKLPILYTIKLVVYNVKNIVLTYRVYKIRIS